MPSRKYLIINETMNRVAKDITDRPNNYMSFLITAANNHKYRFEDQLLIFAQKPNATACAEVDTWNKLGRWVNRGTKGIALIRNRDTAYKLRYVFDISDTNSLYGHTVELWQMKPQYEEAVCDALENSFGEVANKGTLERVLIATARNAVEDNYTDYLAELVDSRRDSFLEELDEFNVDVYFKDLLCNSVSYMLLERCGFDGENYFDIEDFREITQFNTKETISILGTASRDISSMVLMEIEKTVRSLKKEEKNQNRTFDKKDEIVDNIVEEKSGERSNTNDQPNHLQTRGRLLDSELSSTGVPEGGQVWNVATHIPPGTQERSVLETLSDGKTERALGTGGQGSQRNDGTVNRENERSTASDGKTQSGESNALGSEDEQHSVGGGGNRAERVDLPLIEGDPFTSEGVEYFHQDHEKCELIKNSPALKEHRTAIAAYFRDHPDSKERGDFLMQFFTEKPQEFILSNGVTAGYKAYKNRLHMWRGSFDSRERDCYEPWWRISGYIKGMLLMHTWDDSLFPSEQEQIERVKAQNEKKLYLPQEAIDYILTGGSGFSEGKLRIYTQFAKNEATDKNIAFLKNEYGQGGRSDAIPGTGYWEQHDAKGIAIADHYVTDTKNVLSWSYVNNRIKELIELDRYLTPKEKEGYPAYLKRTMDTNKRWEIGKEFRDIIRDYNDFQEQLGNNDDKLNTYVLVDCASEFGIGKKLTYVSHSKGDFVLPLMREAMNKIIAEKTHLTERCEKVLELLQSDVAKPLEPTYDELNSPPEAPKEYQYHLGDTVHLGIDEYEVLAFDDTEVTLYDVKFPLFNKTFSKEEFEKLLAENPFNDHLLVEVTDKPVQETSTSPNTTPIGEDDYYFFREDKGIFEAVYYNPDANSGGEFCIIDIPYDLIKEAKRDSKNAQQFFDYIDNSAYVEYIEHGTDEFEEMLKKYANPSPDFIGRTESSMKALIDKAESELRKTPTNDREVDVLCDILTALKLDDIEVRYENQELVATDGETTWRGKEFYEFLNYDVFTYEDNGSVNGITEELFADFFDLAKQNGVLAQDNRYSPSWMEYNSIKAEYPDSIVLFQIGDFYEVMGSDANILVEELELTLTKRFLRTDEYADMVGFPLHVLNKYSDKLLNNGHNLVVASLEDDKRIIKTLTPIKEVEAEKSLAARLVDFYKDYDYYDYMDSLEVGDTDEDAIKYMETNLKDSQSVSALLEVLNLMISEGELEEAQKAEITELINDVEKIKNGFEQPEFIINNEGSVQMNLDFTEAGVTTEESEPEFKFTEPTPVKKEKVRPNVLLPEIPSYKRNDFKITDDNLGVGTPSERYENNVAAIRLLKKLESEKRLATPEEQEVLSKYVGWGGLADCFDEKHSKYLELKSLLDESEYEAARESTLTAFYTPPIVIRSMYNALENMNFKTGNILEPSCGIGNFMGMLPENLSSSKIYGIELDSISARIAQQLYQNSSIAPRGYEATKLPDSFFDCAIGNVPFGQFKVMDKRYDKHNFLIHDYFFARTLDKVRPGGIVAFVTSKGTLDKENPNVRKYIAQRADLIGAIRLPNNTFKSAAGTEVTSDIIFLQKRDRIIDTDPDWVHLNTDENGVKMNQYFIDNPDMIMGEMKMVSGPFGPESACVPYEGQNLEDLLNDAIQNIHAEITEYDFEDFEDDEIDNSIPADPEVRNFSYTIYDGKVYYRENSRMKPVEVSMTAENRIKGLIEIRDCVRTLIEYQTEDYPDYEIRKQQYKLNEVYDKFNKKYGRINSRANSSAFSSDNSYFLLASLEVLDEEGNFVRKADMFNKRTIKQKVNVTSVDTASEALSVSLAERTTVDIPFMAQLTGKTEDEVIEDLTGVIFQNIGGEDETEYVTADEYLSGNVREKLRIAKLKNEADGNNSFDVNVKALEAVQPTELTASEISVRLGATWLPTDVIDDFMYELFSMAYYMRYNVKTHYSKYTGEWNIQGKSYDRSNVKAYNTYGTSRINGFKILEETLNLRDVRIFDYVEDERGNKVAVLNKKETAIAQGKQELIKNAFQEWIWNDPERRERLCKMYNEKFNSHRAREYDGDHLNFVGINPEITLRKHQVDAVARGIYGQNELLAHVVGAGKTFTMVAIAQESKRLGLCQKSMFVVPNHLTSQWASEYLQLYPSANILVATKKDFETKNRKKFCGRIATGDYDAVIIGHSQFEKIPMSQERQIQMLNRQMHEILNGIEELKRNRGDNFSIKQLERSRKSIKQKLDKLNDQSRKDDVVTFEELGIDRLFIDEAHYYKNLAAFTKMRNVAGISQTEAMKSSDLYMKCRYLDEITGGRGTCFATGTPISNSMVEMYTMQKYLQYNTLKERDLIHFDAWASNYGETITAIELAPEGTGYRAKTRFAKFYNLPELIMMFKEVADIQTADMLNLPVPKANYHNVVLKPSEHQKEFVASLSERAEKVRNKMVDSSVDNMLLITNDGRKLALDQRLMNDMLPDHEDSKTSACANNVFEIWQKTADKKSTQMIFCDLSTPHGDGKFNVYDDIKQKLIEKGIPEEEIAYIHSANSDAQKKELFGKVRAGQIRVLMGSTQKMGAGTNVQKRLIALHHLDCPWRPSDLQQREGRIIRQGNDNPEVEIYSYVTENTFDAYLYQLVESKQKFIGQIMTSKSPVRSAEDVDETALSYAEIKALASGNPHIKEKMDLDIEVQKLKLLKANHQSQKFALEDMILKSIPAKISAIEQRIEGYDADIKRREENTRPNADGFSPMQIDGVVYTDKKEAGTALLEYTEKMKTPDAVRMGSYRGFALEMSFEHFSKEYVVTLKGSLTHSTPLGTDIFGNILRLDNVLNAFEEKQIHCREQLDRERGELENAKTEVQKPFPKEEEYRAKVKRLDELNILLNMDKKENEIVDGERGDENEENTPERTGEAR